jgi:uncharacterized protein YndB with AHSA1/START domain
VRSSATLELLAPVEDVWAFLAEPYNFADWWPLIGGVQPDRRGFAEGARWTLIWGGEPGLLHRPRSPSLLVVTAVEPFRRFAFSLVGDRIDGELILEPAGHDHTLVTLTVGGGFGRSAPFKRRPEKVLRRIYDLIQTAAPSQD